MESDEEFALLADAVEEAVSKRRKMANSFSGTPHKQPETEEGQYTAALRGSKSQLWQVLNNKKRPFENASSTGRQGFYNSYRGPATAFADTEEEQQMQCPSCRTPCVVLVSKSERNPGRKFYKCTEDNGGCGFFQWCDSSAQMQHAPAKNFNADALGFEASLDCPCGAGLCVVLTAKTQKNMGRQFFRCPLPQGQGCDFFKWCDSVSSPSPRTADVPSPNSKSSAFNSPKSGCFPCFKCGMEGHWARDCPSASASQGIKNASQSQNTCFKCGQAGHWARDCPAEKLNASFSHRSGTR